MDEAKNYVKILGRTKLDKIGKVYLPKIARDLAESGEFLIALVIKNNLPLIVLYPLAKEDVKEIEEELAKVLAGEEQ